MGISLRIVVEISNPYRHARALEQAKKSLPECILIVGVCSDKVTEEYKGKTVMNEQERYESLRHCKWVDEVIENVPWIITEEFMEKHDIDYVAHDALPYNSGHIQDVYAHVKSLKKFISTKRTNGISTTDLITRILRDRQEYMARNFDRGISCSEMNVSLLTVITTFKEVEMME